MKLTEPTRKHGFRILPHFPCSVEACSLAVGEMVVFVGSVEDADRVMENGIEVNNHFFPVLPLTKPAVEITVRADVLTRELSRYCKVVSRVTKVSPGCKSLLLRQVVGYLYVLH